jgi:ubiquinone/menaquinone biosynthesis C-methylase UbiE
MSHYKPNTENALAECDRHALNHVKERPSYPKEAIRSLRNALGIISGKTVVDLAAGTGKLTESLLDANIQLTAIEPEEEMRRIYAYLFPQITLLNGTAESIPLPDNSVDAVLVGTAFHCFDGIKALSEISRVLKSKGGLGLIWNVFDDNFDWIRKMYGIRAKICENLPLTKNANLEWKKVFEETPHKFFPLQHRTISFSYLGKAQRIMERMLSSSMIDPLPKEKQEFLIKEICQLLEISHAETNEKELLIPYRTEIYWTFKL